MRAKYLVAVLLGAIAVLAGVLVAVGRDGPSSGRGKPILRAPRPIATVTGETCREHLKRNFPEMELPDAKNCSAFIYRDGELP